MGGVFSIFLQRPRYFLQKNNFQQDGFAKTHYQLPNLDRFNFHR